MLFAVGTKVRFRRTGDIGVVTSILEGGLLSIYIEASGMEIPTFQDDLERVETKATPGARVVKGKKTPAKKQPPPAAVAPQYAILKSEGIQLAFDPQYLPDGRTESFDVFLINDTASEVLYTISLFFEDGIDFEKQGRLAAESYHYIESILFDDLNEGPVFEIDCWEVLPTGTGKKLHRQLRIKPKAFFNTWRTAPLLDRKVHWYLLFEDLKAASKKTGKSEDLQTYTQKNLRPASKPKKNSRYPVHDIQELAAFSSEIDLHIDKLVNDPADLSNKDIVRIQMQAFEKYLNNAVRLGIERVFIIHGVGTGALKNRITEALILHPQVRSFKNEFHPRYGWGATEVEL
ncbi:MAG: Smr/MutS family protein [Phaeodactylibacter sp.]|nr:Smr/MutS family protein [Phaeodactylibacter sp.]